MALHYFSRSECASLYNYRQPTFMSINLPKKGSRSFTVKKHLVVQYL